MLIMGYGPSRPRDAGPVAPAVCPNCANSTVFRLFVVRDWFRLFFVPVVPGRHRAYVVCPVCHYAIEVDSDQLRAAELLVATTERHQAGAIDTATYYQQVDRFWSLLGGMKLKGQADQAFSDDFPS